MQKKVSGKNGRSIIQGLQRCLPNILSRGMAHYAECLKRAARGFFFLQEDLRVGRHVGDPVFQFHLLHPFSLPEEPHASPRSAFCAKKHRLKLVGSFPWFIANGFPASLFQSSSLSQRNRAFADTILKVLCTRLLLSSLSAKHYYQTG